MPRMILNKKKALPEGALSVGGTRNRYLVVVVMVSVRSTTSLTHTHTTELETKVLAKLHSTRMVTGLL